MYDRIIGNISDRIIDSTVDNAIDSIKNKNLANTTYVWTAISRETFDSKTANIVFINKLGQRQRVAYDMLPDFCLRNYVSNVLVSEGKVEFIGCSIRDLPDYRYSSNGSYSLHGLYTEADIYNKATPYIYNMESKIAEDIRSGYLKGGKTTGGTQTDITKNISAIKDISMATAATAMSVAGIAAVAGVATATTAGVKAISKQVNKKKNNEIMADLYNKFKYSGSLVGAMIKMKRLTNYQIKQSNGRIEYTNILEARNDKVGTVGKVVKSSGVIGAISKIESMIEQYRSEAIANGVFDESLQTLGYGATTLHIYSDGILRKLDELKQLHSETSTLIQQLTNENNRREQLELEQTQLIAELTREFAEFDAIISDFDIKNIDDSEIVAKQMDFESKDIDTLVNNTKASIEMLVDNCARESYLNRLNNTRNKILIIGIDLKRKADQLSSIARDKFNNIMTEAEWIIGDIILNSYCGNIQAGLDKANALMTEAKSICDKSTYPDKSEFIERVSRLEKKMEKNKYTISSVINIGKQDERYVSEVKEFIKQSERESSGMTKSKDLEAFINNFRSRSMRKIGMIKNSDLAKSCKEDVENVITGIELNLSVMKSMEEAKENSKNIAIGLNMNDMRDKLERIKAFNIGDATEESIKSLDIDFNYYESIFRQYTYSETKDARELLLQLKNEHRRILREAQAVVDKENRSIKNIEDTLRNIEYKIIYKLNKYTKDGILESIHKIKYTDYYTNIRDKREIDSKIEGLIGLYNERVGSI